MKEVNHMVRVAYIITGFLTVFYFCLFIATLILQSLMLSFISTLIVILNFWFYKTIIKKCALLNKDSNADTSRQVYEASKINYIPSIILLGLTVFLYFTAIRDQSFMMDNVFSFHGYQIVGQIWIFTNIKKLNSSYESMNAI